MLKSAQRAAGGKRSFELPGGPDDERPLHERIKRFVLAKIDAGSWPEGHRVPSETELATAFGTARMTVHGALHDLAAAGILTRRQDRGARRGRSCARCRRRSPTPFRKVRDGPRAMSRRQSWRARTA